MPTLAETIAQGADDPLTTGVTTASTRPSTKKQVLTRDPTGQLVTTDQNDLQALTAKAGLPAAPTTPTGQALIGANPDQQKMAGTPQQKLSALSASANHIPASDSLAQNQATSQVRTQQTSGEQANTQKSADLQNLGAVGDRVNDLINAQRTKFVDQAAAPTQAAVSTTAVNPLGGSPLTPAQQAALTTWAANPSDIAATAAANQALGYTTWDAQLSPDQLGSLYQTAAQTIAGNTDQATTQTATVQDLVNTGNLGYTLPQLADLLGTPADQLATMTPTQLSALVNQVGTQSQSQAQQHDQAQTSVNLGAAQRGQALQAARTDSATGVRGSEAAYSGLEQAVANGDQVKFGGNTYRVEDLLSDHTISKLVSQYLTAPAGSPTRTQLEQTEPGLVQFVQQHQAALTQASQEMAQSATNLAGVNKANKQLVTSSFGGVNLPDSVLHAILPNAGKLSTTSIDPNSVPLLAYAKQVGPEAGKAIATNLQAATAQGSQLGVDIGAQVASLSADQLHKLGIADTTGSSPFSKYQQQLQSAAALRQVDPSNPDQAISALSGGGISSWSQLQQAQQSSKALANLGLPSTDPLAGTPLSGVTSPSQLGPLLANYTKVPSLSDVANGTPVGSPGLVKANSTAQSTLPPGLNEAVAKLGPLLSAGGAKLSADQLVQAGLSSTALGALKQQADQNVSSGGVHNGTMLDPTSISRAIDRTTGVRSAAQLQALADKGASLQDQLLAAQKMQQDPSQESSQVDQAVVTLQQAVQQGASNKAFDDKYGSGVRKLTHTNAPS